MEHINELIRDHFSLKIALYGHHHQTIVVGSHKYYPRVFSEKIKKVLTPVFMDTRGFAPTLPSQESSDFTREKIIEDIEALRVLLNMDKIILVGHSIHGFMALDYAQRFPDKVRHLVLIALSPMVGPEIYQEGDNYFENHASPQRKAAFDLSMKTFIQSNHHSFIARMLAFGPRLWYDENFHGSKLWEGVDINVMGAEIIWGSMFQDYDIASALRNIKCPIFLGLGRHDYFNPPYLWEKYHSHGSNLEICIFEKSGHTPQLEEPENFYEKLSLWLKNTSPLGF